MVEDVELTVYYRCNEEHVMLFEIPGLRDADGSLRMPSAWVAASAVTLPPDACKP